MPRDQFQTLSEPMYYVLLALTEECCGIDIMGRVAEISGGRVAVGPGTLYAMLDKFLKSGLIRETAVNLGRRRTYLITDKGRTLLHEEYGRLYLLTADGYKILGEK